MSVWTVVVAAGASGRFGSDKQAAELAGATVLERSVATASRASNGVVVVVAADRVGEVQGMLGDAAEVEVVAGGDTRSASVRAGLAAVPDGVEVVLVHDGARPLASEALFGRVVAAVLDGAEAAVPAVAVSDSIRSVDGGPLDRDRVLAIQTPQGFPATLLRAAHARGGDAGDDATLVEAAGGKVVIVDGEPGNLKITTPADLQAARGLACGGPEGG